jgi:hypothetical protein
VDLSGQNLKLSVGVTCRDGADAAQGSNAIRGIWDKAKVLLGFAKSIPQLGKALGEVQQSFAVEERDSTTLASVQLNQDTLLELTEAAPNLMNLGLPSGVNPAAPPVLKQESPRKKN